MKLLIIILNKQECLEKILSILLELGVPGATIMDSEGLGHYLAYEVPIFAGLRQLMGEEKSASKTILAFIKKEEGFLVRLKTLLAQEDVDFTQPGTGIIATLPVEEIIKPENNLT